jgi:regulator of sigma E protease
VAAGPAANFLFAIVVTAIVFATMGQQLTATDVGKVTPGSAAEAAGLKVGDKILAVNGQPIHRFEDLASLVQIGLGEPLKLQVQRGSETMEIAAQPKVVQSKDIFGSEHPIGLLGITSSGPGEVVHYNPVNAVVQATVETYRTAVNMLKTIGQMFTGARPSSEVAGVITIAQMSSDVFNAGLWATISFIILISINLGLINLFPVPLLDGGHLMFYVFEAVSGRQMGRRAEEWGMRLGLALVLSLMLFAAWNDLVRIGVIRFITNLFA